MANEKVIYSKSNPSLLESLETNNAIKYNQMPLMFSFLNYIWIDRRLIMSDAAKSFDSNSSSTTLKETRIDNRIECSSSLASKKFHKLQRQDSIDQAQNISNNNQDVGFNFNFAFTLNWRLTKEFNCNPILFCHRSVAVHCSFITGTTF